MSVTRHAALGVLVAGLALGAVHAGHADPARSARKAEPAAIAIATDPGLVLGEFPLTKVVDGDTIKVDGLDSSLRLLGIDTEETFKSKKDRKGAAEGLDPYRVAKRGDSARPVKMATPMGEQAKAFAKQFFDGIDKVRLERDHPAEVRDRYNRYLAYVLVQRNGAWVNYNVACVRAGMAPYFPKYGTSRRFHAEFIAAEAAAKRAHLGIWAPGAPGYTDYTEREAWWTARGAFVDAFRRDADGKPGHIDITHTDAVEQLEALVGKPVTVLGIVGDIQAHDRGPTKVMLSRRMGSDFPLIFFQRDVLASSGIAAWKGEFVVVTGVPSIYESKRDHSKQLQIVINRPAQIRLSAVPGLELPRPADVTGATARPAGPAPRDPAAPAEATP